MAVQGRLYTLDRVERFVGEVGNICCLCQEEPESHQHLFFKCSFSGHVLQRVLELVDYPMVADCLDDWKGRFGRAKKPQSALF